MGYVHIDDVASSHILVYEAPEATGRYLCSSVVLDNNELVSLLAKRYPIFPVPRRSVAIVRNKPVARASTGLITFGCGPAARVAFVSVSELSPCPGRMAIEQLAPVYVCVMGVCLQLATYAAWWSCMESVAIHRELHVSARRGGGRSLRIERQSGAA
jgi:hypothetical protein